MEQAATDDTTRRRAYGEHRTSDTKHTYVELPFVQKGATRLRQKPAKGFVLVLKNRKCMRAQTHTLTHTITSNKMSPACEHRRATAKSDALVEPAYKARLPYHSRLNCTHLDSCTQMRTRGKVAATLWLLQGVPVLREGRGFNAKRQIQVAHSLPG